MLARWALAALHLLALGIGLGAVWARGSALRRPLDREGYGRVFYADTLWGVAALLWISTGLVRLFGGFEKGSAYYMHNGAFLAKMALLALVLGLEIWPMATLIRWRVAHARGEEVDDGPAPRIALISRVQAGLIMAMVFAATAMARGFGVL